MHVCMIVEIIYDDEGRELEIDDTKYIWLDPTLLGDVPSSDLLPSIAIPLCDSLNHMVRLLSLMKVALKHNFISAFLTIAGGVMALHLQEGDPGILYFCHLVTC